MGSFCVFAVRRALQPVRALAVAARSVDLADLKSRVPEQDRQDEVGMMAREFNRMLDRVSEDEQQRQRLLSAISHELRSPLAVASGHLELFETLGARPGYTAADTAAVVRRELDRLGRIVDDLTAINQGDIAGATAREPVFAPDVLSALGDRIEGLDLPDVSLTPAPPVVLLGDEDRLTQALLNLVVNARTHTPAETHVRSRPRLPGIRSSFGSTTTAPASIPRSCPECSNPSSPPRPVGWPEHPVSGWPSSRRSPRPRAARFSSTAAPAAPRSPSPSPSIPATEPPATPSPPV